MEVLNPALIVIGIFVSLFVVFFQLEKRKDARQEGITLRQHQEQEPQHDMHVTLHHAFLYAQLATNNPNEQPQTSSPRTAEPRDISGFRPLDDDQRAHARWLMEQGKSNNYIYTVFKGTTAKRKAELTEIRAELDTELLAAARADTTQQVPPYKTVAEYEQEEQDKRSEPLTLATASH